MVKEKRLNWSILSKFISILFALLTNIISCAAHNWIGGYANRFLSHEARNIYKQSHYSLNIENIYIQLGTLLFHKDPGQNMYQGNLGRKVYLKISRKNKQTNKQIVKQQLTNFSFFFEHLNS